MKTEKLTALLQNSYESLDVEMKNWLGGISSNEEKSKLAREIIALANNGGGYIIIGFDDKTRAEIEPRSNELEAFSQDSISGVVHRYIEPSFQVSVDQVVLPESGEPHPVITVPGKHRTPVWAKRQSPDGSNTLQTGTVYIRRPGGHSEPPRTQDDWERLIDRLVRARQADLVDAVRNVLDPVELSAPTQADSLRSWLADSAAAWEDKVRDLADGDVRKYAYGYWTATFAISEFECESARELRNFLQREMPRFSGWPPFVVIDHDDKRPVPTGRTVEAWLGAPASRHIDSREAQIGNYWRASIDGFGYVVNGYGEDDPDYCENRTPRPVGKKFDKIFHPYNVVELLLTIRALAQRFASKDSTYTLHLGYNGMSGRQLEVHDLRWIVARDGECKAENVESTHSGYVSTLNTSIEEEAIKILAPVFEYFDFAEVNKHAVRQAVAKLANP